MSLVRLSGDLSAAKRANLVGRRNDAGQIERHATQELFVVGRPGRGRKLEFRQARFDEPIDLDVQRRTDRRRDGSEACDSRTGEQQQLRRIVGRTPWA